MNKPPNKLDNGSGEDDFTTSMARLAELAAQNIESNEKKKEKEQSELDEEFREFMTAKRKIQQNTSWSARIFGRSHKLHINPYVASGFLIILISAGFICAPRISKYFEEQEAELERKKAAAAQIAAQTDASLRNYTVFDAARDVSGNDQPLKTKSISELALEVAEANEKFGSKLEVAWNFTNFNLSPESISDTTTEDYVDSSDTISGETTILENEVSSLSEDWAEREINLNLNTEFSFEEQCIDPSLLYDEGGIDTVFKDILLYIGAIGGQKLATRSCS